MRPATLRQLGNWLKTAKRGQWVCYWEGDLRFDRHQEEESIRLGLGAIPNQPDAYPARVVGPWLWEQQVASRVTLWQKKLGFGKYLYLARKEVTG